MADNTEFITYQIQVDTKSGKINVDNITKGFTEANSAFSKLHKDIKKNMPDMADAMDTTSKATGGATASVMEMSRVVSDMPYGIRGVANNLTQLVSQFGFTAKAAGGAKAALKEMGKLMLGPLGIVFAITAVISALDYFYGAQKKAEDSAKDLTQELQKQVDVLEAHNTALDRDNLSLEDRVGIIKSLSVTSNEFRKILKQTNGSYEEQVKALRDLLYEKKQELVIREKVARFEEIEKELSESRFKTLKQANDEIKRQNDLRKQALKEGGSTSEGEKMINAIYDRRVSHALKIVRLMEEEKNLLTDINGLAEDVRIIEKGSEAQLKAELNGLKEKQSAIEGLTDTWYAYELEIIEVEKALKKIQDFGKKNKGSKPAKINPFATPEELELSVKSQLDAVDAYRKKIEIAELDAENKRLLKTVTSEEEKKAIKIKYEKDKLDITLKYEEEALNKSKNKEIAKSTNDYNNYVKSLDKKQDIFIKKTNENSKYDKKTRAKLIADSIKETEEAKTKAFLNLGNNVKQIEEQYKPLFELFRTLAKARRDGIGGDSEIETEQERLRRLYEVKKFWADQFMKVANGATDFINGEFDRQLATERNKTNALNNELNQRLLNENLSKEERKRIQLQIGANDEALRKKQEAIEKKRFKLNKAANIANATINTYLAATQVMSSLTVPAWMKVPMAIATVSSGLLQVAAIARQKFQSSAGSGGQIGGGFGGGSGSGNGREFNFNLAGSSDRNQIAEAIGSRFDQPLRAYVVSRDVTTQQQIDADIRSNASF